MTPPTTVAVVLAVTGVVVAAGVRPVLARLPEPVDAGVKPPYRLLATAGFVTACVLCALSAQGIALAALPASVQPLWSVLAVFGVVLAAVDARTTWLPLRLTRAAWVAMTGAALATLLLGATVSDLLRTAAGAALAGLLYLFVWAVTRGGFGYGDVRFAPLLGAATASGSWTLLIWGLTLGTTVGAVHGAVRLLARRHGAFPYAPSMLAGSYLAVVALLLVPG